MPALRPEKARKVRATSPPKRPPARRPAPRGRRGRQPLPARPPGPRFLPWVSARRLSEQVSRLPFSPRTHQNWHRRSKHRRSSTRNPIPLRTTLRQTRLAPGRRLCRMLSHGMLSRLPPRCIPPRRIPPRRIAPRDIPPKRRRPPHPPSHVRAKGRAIGRPLPPRARQRRPGRAFSVKKRGPLRVRMPPCELERPSAHSSCWIDTAANFRFKPSKRRRGVSGL